MVLYNINDVVPGMVLARSIVLPAGEFMLAAGTGLTPRYVNRLKKLGIDSIYIEVEGTEHIDPQSIISTQIQREMASRLIKSGQNLQHILKMKKFSQEKVQDFIENNKTEINKYISSNGFVETLNTVVESVLNYPEVIVNLVSLEKKADFLFEHALRVTIMSLCIAKAYDFMEDEMKQLALGAINSDIGLVAVPKHVVTTNDKLDGDELRIFQKHVEYGYKILSQNPAIPATSASVAYQHHECQDGSGYPKGLKGENRPPSKSLYKNGVIHRFSEIVAIADKFDVLVEGRSPYGYKLSRKEAMKILFLCADSKLNSDIVLAFSKITPIYPIGTRVRIIRAPLGRYTGHYGAVVNDNIENLEKPQIVIFEDRFHKRIKPFMVDLDVSDDYRIEAVL